MSNISPAQRRAVEKYNAAHYKQIKLRLTLEQSELAHSFARCNGFADSFNAFVWDCIQRRVKEATSAEVTVPIFESCSTGDMFALKTDNIKDNTITIDLEKRLKDFYQALANSKNTTLERYIIYTLEAQCGAISANKNPPQHGIFGKKK